MRHTGETSKPKPALSRCTGNFAGCIWWLTERIALSGRSTCSRSSISQREDSMPTQPLFDQIGPRTAHVVQAQCLGFEQRVSLHGRLP